jgi:hypothetical protein
MPKATTSVDGYLSSTDWTTFNSKGSGSVTSVAQSFTGGLISVAGSPITSSGTLALTVAGTSGGIPYFSSTSTWATSAALAASSIVIGGGAGAAPSTTTTGTGVVTALGVNTGSAGAFVVNGGALGTPSSGTVTNLTGTASININGTVGATTPSTGAFTTLSTTGVATTAGHTNTTSVSRTSTNSNAYQWSISNQVNATNNATVSVLLLRDSAGSVVGDVYISGTIFLYVSGASGANAFAATYALCTTGNSTSQAILTTITSVTRGTSPVSSVQIAADGSGGSVKLTVTYINDSGVVTGGKSYAGFNGIAW